MFRNMWSLRNYVRLTIVMAFVWLAALLLSHLALTDIYHGETDLSQEWYMVRITLVIQVIFIAVTLVPLRPVLRSIT